MEENPALEHATPRDIATSAHYRMDSHESLCLERHKSLQEKMEQAAIDRGEIKAMIFRIESRMWSVITAAAFAMLSVVVTLVGGILLYLAG